MMDHLENLEQQLWELVYELLPDDQAQRMCDIIADDPDVARLYAEVKLRSELVAEASRLPSVHVPLPTPHLLREHANEAGQFRVAAAPDSAVGPPSATADQVLGGTGPLAAPAATVRPWLATTMRLCASLAAVLLVGFVGFAYLKPQSPLRPAQFQADQKQWSERPVRTMVLAPSRLQARPSNYLTVMTRSLADRASSTPIAYRLLGEDDRVLLDERAQTDASGILQIETPAELGDRFVRFEVRPLGDGIAAPLSHTFPIAPFPWLTHLWLDATTVEPGRSLRYRTVSLSSFDLRSDQEIEVQVQLIDAAAHVLDQISSQALTENGVRYGHITIPLDAAPGTYRVVARSPQGHFDPVSRTVLVRADQGVQSSEAAESLDADHGPADGLSVDFYPESGELVAGVSNRVYFHARDDQGQPIAIKGRIVDQADRLQTDVQTEMEGRGVFVLTPEPDRRYRLEIESPGPTTESFRLPSAVADRWLVLDAGPGVFKPGSELVLNLRSTDCSRPLAIVATCRGAVVGQQIVTGDQFLKRETEPNCGYSQIRLPIAPKAQGVIRVAAYDLSTQPAGRVAERLVYRPPHWNLHVQVNALRSHYAPGDEVHLQLNVRDESGQEQPAVLGVAVIDDHATWQLPRHAASLTKSIWLTSQVDDPETVEAADVDPLARRAETMRLLDLLLGTQRASRPEHAADGWLAGIDRSDPAAATESILTTVAVAESGSPQIVADNTHQVRLLVDRSLADLRTARQSDLRRMGLLVLLGGILVTVATLMLGLLRGSGGPYRWAPNLAVACLGMIMGIFWVSAKIDSQGQLSWSRISTQDRTDWQLAEAVPRSTVAEDSAIAFEASAGELDAEATPKSAERAEPAAMAYGEIRDQAPEMAPMAEIAAQDFAAPAPAAAPLPAAPSAVTRPEAVAGGMGAMGGMGGGTRMDARGMGDRDMGDRDMGDMGMGVMGMEALREPAASMEMETPEVMARSRPLRAGDRAADDLFYADEAGDEGIRYWNPVAVADEQGQYRLSLSLPRQHARYRLIIDAHHAGRIGSQQAEIVIGKATP